MSHFLKKLLRKLRIRDHGKKQYSQTAAKIQMQQCPHQHQGQ